MPNKNYIKGRRKEYAIVKRLKEEGYDLAQRTAGSHSEVDIIAIRRRDKRIKLIQAKPNSYSDNATQKIIQKNAWMNDEFMVEFVVE